MTSDSCTGRFTLPDFDTLYTTALREKTTMLHERIILHAGIPSSAYGMALYLLPYTLKPNTRFDL